MRHFLVDASIAIKSSWENLLETEYIKRDHDVPFAPKIKIKDGPPPYHVYVLFFFFLMPKIIAVPNKNLP